LATPDDLAPGAYTVVVTDGRGCSSTCTVTIGDGNPLSCTAQGTDASCGANDGSATVQVNGGQGAITYLWSDGQTTQTASNLAAGTFTVTATDNRGCTTTCTVTIGGGTAASVEITGGGTITCTNPTVSLTAVTSATQVTWTGPNGFTSNQANIEVAAGTYTVNITTAAGCTASSSVTIQGDSNIPSVTATGGTITCLESSTVLTATSSIADVTYAWTGPNGFTSSSANPSVAEDGTYTVTVTTPSGCIDSTSTLVIRDTDAPFVEVVGGSITCSNASVILGVETNGIVMGWAGDQLVVHR